MTGKGDRWEGDRRLGGSAPAFLAASTTALPPSTCTARREAGQLCGQLLFLLRGRPTAGCLFEACAGWRVRRLCCLQRPGSAGCVCLPCHLCHVIPLPFSTVCPRSLCFDPCSFHVRQYRREELFVSPPQATCLQAARLSCWQLQHGPAVAARAPVHRFDFYPFFLQSP